MVAGLGFTHQMIDAFRTAVVFDLTKLSGHKQFTDVLLLAIARQNDGRLLRLDLSIPWRAVKGASAEDVEVIEDVSSL